MPFFVFPFTYLLDYFLGEILLESEMPCLMAGMLEELRVDKAPILPDPEREPVQPRAGGGLLAWRTVQVRRPEARAQGTSGLGIRVCPQPRAPPTPPSAPTCFSPFLAPVSPRTSCSLSPFLFTPERTLCKLEFRKQHTV